MRDRATRRPLAGAYRLGWAVVRWLPPVLARLVFRVIAEAAWLRRGRGVRQLATNLRRVAGREASEQRVRRLTRAALCSYSRYWMEVFRLPVMDPDRIDSRFRVYGGQLLWSALESGRGVVLALPHSGNWDHAGAWITLSGHPFTTVAERVRPEPLYDSFVAFRERLGMEVLPLTGATGAHSGGVYDALAERLRAGRLVCLLADRDLTATGVEVSFFGEPARMPAGPAALALDTGAALLPVTLWYEGKAWAGRVHWEVEAPEHGTRHERVRVMTQAMAAAFEETIAAYPQDWHMLQRLWTADLDRGRPPSPAASPAGGEARGRRGGVDGSPHRGVAP